MDPQPRYGYGKPLHGALHARIEQNRSVYRNNLTSFLDFTNHLKRIPLARWRNGFLSGLDAAALYGFVAARKPRRYFEVGSGHSTRFVRQAIIDHHLPTTITSIDPAPRAAVESICDRQITKPVEQVSIDLFDELEAGDVLFVDSSHRVFTNSDATVVFLDILPRLASGVLVQIHDIFLPLDYPPDWSKRYYSEQYLLACYLLAGGQRFQIELPNAFVSEDAELSAILAPLWKQPELDGVERRMFLLDYLLAEWSRRSFFVACLPPMAGHKRRWPAPRFRAATVTERSGQPP